MSRRDLIMEKLARALLDWHGLMANKKYERFDHCNKASYENDTSSSAEEHQNNVGAEDLVDRVMQEVARIDLNDEDVIRIEIQDNDDGNGIDKKNNNNSSEERANDIDRVVKDLARVNVNDEDEIRVEILEREEDDNVHNNNNNNSKESQNPINDTNNNNINARSQINNNNNYTHYNNESRYTPLSDSSESSHSVSFEEIGLGRRSLTNELRPLQQRDENNANLDAQNVALQAYRLWPMAPESCYGEIDEGLKFLEKRTLKEPIIKDGAWPGVMRLLHFIEQLYRARTAAAIEKSKLVETDSSPSSADSSAGDEILTWDTSNEGVSDGVDGNVAEIATDIYGRLGPSCGDIMIEITHEVTNSWRWMRALKKTNTARHVLGLQNDSPPERAAAIDENVAKSSTVERGLKNSKSEEKRVNKEYKDRLKRSKKDGNRVWSK